MGLAQSNGTQYTENITDLLFYVNGTLNIGDYDPNSSAYLSTINCYTNATQQTAGGFTAKSGGTINIYASQTQATPVQMAANQPQQSSITALQGGILNFTNKWSSGAAAQTVALPVYDQGTMNINDGIWNFSTPDKNNRAIYVMTNGNLNINQTYVAPVVSWTGQLYDNLGTLTANTNCTLRGSTTNDTLNLATGTFNLNNYVVTVGVTTIGNTTIGTNMIINSQIDQHDSCCGELKSYDANSTISFQTFSKLNVTEAGPVDPNLTWNIIDNSTTGKDFG
jgi:hypothetical protein